MRILHTADWQIGMRAKHVGLGGVHVRAQRILSAKALAAVAREHAVDAVFVAGDVFEDNAVDRTDVQSVIDACAGFGVPTYVLPGNHDPLTTGSVWEHGGWDAATNVHVLRTSEPLTMGPGITLYPCPAFTKMSSADPTAWIADASTEGTRIGIAHGTVMNAMVAEDCFPIRRDAASALGLDYLALGHWHSFAPYEGDAAGARMAYSGTHETTKFGERDSGNVVIVELAGRGDLPRLTRVPTGALHWHQLVCEIGGAMDLERIIHEIDALPDPSHSLLEVRLTGILRPAELKQLGELRDRIASRFTLLGRVDDSGLLPAPEDDAWAEALPAGLLRDVARAIRVENSLSAAKALMLLYQYGIETGEVAA
jgi:DNA repair exonuclease SbcCD nuclease subunit